MMKEVLKMAPKDQILVALKFSIIIVIYMFLLGTLAACKPGDAGAAGASNGADPTLPDDDQDGADPLDPNQQNPAVLEDHSDRSPEYGTIITEAECRHLAEWDPSLNEMWYFGLAYLPSNPTPQEIAQVDAYNDVNDMRLELGSVTIRHFDGTRWIGRFVTNEWWRLSRDCNVHIASSVLGIDVVMWRGAQIN